MARASTTTGAEARGFAGMAGLALGAGAAGCGAFVAAMVLRLHVPRGAADALILATMFTLPAAAAVLLLLLARALLRRLAGRGAGDGGRFLACSLALVPVPAVATVVALRPFWAGDPAHLGALAGALAAALVLGWILARALRGRLLLGAALALAAFLAPGAAALLAVPGPRAEPPGGAGESLAREDPGSSGVLVIGLDGATFDVLDPLVATGRLPHIGGLMEEGARCTLLSEVAPVQPFADSASRGMRTPVVWETIVTGTSPVDHGIWDFYMTRLRGLSRPLPFRLPLPGPLDALYGASKRPLLSTDGREPRLWELFGAAGESSRTVGWVHSWPAFDWGHCRCVSSRAHYGDKGMAHPPSLEEEFAWFYAYLPRIAEEELGLTFNPYYRSDEQPGTPGWEENAEIHRRLFGPDRAVVEGWYREHLYVPMAREHLGFALDPGWRETYPDEDDPRHWEHRLVESQTAHMVEDAHYAGVAAAMLERDLGRGGMPALFAVYFSSTDTGQHLLWQFHEPGAFPGEVAPGSVERLGDALGRVYEHADALVGELLAKLPADATVVLVSDHGGGAWREIAEGGVFPGRSFHPEYTGNHRENGVLVVRGPAARAGHRGVTRDIYDVMPLLLHLSGMPLGEHLPGELPVDLLDEAWMAQHPVRTVPHFGPRRLPEGVLELARGAGGDETFFERLGQLGYGD